MQSAAAGCCLRAAGSSWAALHTNVKAQASSPSPQSSLCSDCMQAFPTFQNSHSSLSYAGFYASIIVFSICFIYFLEHPTNGLCINKSLKALAWADVVPCLDHWPWWSTHTGSCSRTGWGSWEMWRFQRVPADLIHTFSLKTEQRETKIKYNIVLTSLNACICAHKHINTQMYTH